MPRPCAVESHAGGYNNLRRGVSRWRLL